MEFREFSQRLTIRLIVDEGRPGRLYFLNKEKTSIVFILDAFEEIIYINQNIFNVFDIGTIKDELLERNICFDIFPYFDEEGDVADLKPSENDFWRCLMEETRWVLFNDSSCWISTETRNVIMDYSYIDCSFYCYYTIVGGYIYELSGEALKKHFLDKFIIES